jgi:hypothetical protein
VRLVYDLQPGDHVEYTGFQWVVLEVENIITDDPQVHPDDVWFTTDAFSRQRTWGRLEVAVIGCDGCGSKHKPENCRRRSI